MRKGATRTTAAAAAGVDRVTVWRWTQDDPAFAAEVEGADADAEIAMTNVLNEAARREWRAAAWWLERRRPESYGRRPMLRANLRMVAERLRMLADRMAAGEVLDVEELLAEAARVERLCGTPSGYAPPSRRRIG